MTSNTSPPLDSFESALLNRLKEEVGARNHASPAELGASPGLPRRPIRRRRYAAAALIAASVTTAALATHALLPTPAYAVTGRNGSEITVRVMRLEGAGQLEQALRDRGIPADITYLPIGKVCANGRYQAVPTPGLMLGGSEDSFEVTIPAGAVGKGDTFVLAASEVKPIKSGFQSTVEFDIAHGAVAPCTVVDAP